jgi:signal transduction histidine kinase
MVVLSLPSAAGRVDRKSMDVRRAMSTANGFKPSSEDWQSLGGLWDRAALIRAFLWHQQYADAKALLIQLLVRLRRFYSIDFCSGGLIDGEKLTAAAVPEAGLEQLPGNFAGRCLNLVAHARAPITWNEVKAEFGFRSMVVAPIAPPPSGTPVGFLMLGHTSRRVYSAAELFVLQSLANELAWAARELHSQKGHRVQVADLSHDIKNTLQLIVGYTGLIRQNLNGVLGSEQEQFFANIESDVERILRQLSPLAGDGDAPEMMVPVPVNSAAETKKKANS